MGTRTTIVLAVLGVSAMAAFGSPASADDYTVNSSNGTATAAPPPPPPPRPSVVSAVRG